MATLTRQPPRRTTPPPGAGGRPPRPTRSNWRWPAIGALLIVAGVVAYLATRGSEYQYRLDFRDAGQLVSGDLVRIGGTPVGTINSISLTPDGLAQIGISVGSSWGPLHQGTTAVIRSPGLTSVASRYIDISPAPPFKPTLPNNAVIGASHTQGIVDIDQIFDALNGNTREGLRRVIRGFGQWYQGKSVQANLTAQYFPPALTAYTQLFSQIDASTPTLKAFVSQTSEALGAIDQRAPQLTDMISQARITASALASDNGSLTQALSNLPGALRHGSQAFVRLRDQALPALDRLVNATQPVIKPLSQFLPKLNPVLRRMVPTFTLLRQLFDKPGPHNDLVDALVELPAVAREVERDFPHAIKALHEGTPIFEFARPYIPDLVAWVTNWDGIFAPYDANGHYARTVPVVGNFKFTDSSQGGSLTQVPASQRGSQPQSQGRLPGALSGVGDRPPRRRLQPVRRPRLDGQRLALQALRVRRRHPVRLARFGLGLVGTLALVAAVTLGVVRFTGAGAGGYLVRAVFDNSSFVIPGEQVKVAGVVVGTIHAVDLTRRTTPPLSSRSRTTSSSRSAPTPTAKIHTGSLLGEQYVQCTPAQPRSPGTPAPPALAAMCSGPNQGQHLLPVQNTTTPVGLDLLNDIMRLPEQERFRLIIAGLGAGLAGNGHELNVALRRADPALQQTDKVIAVLASEDHTLAQLTDDSATDLRPLAAQRAGLGSFIDHAGSVAETSAQESRSIAQNFHDFPAFLRQLKPYSQRLTELADQMTPALQSLQAQAPVNASVHGLGPLADSGSIPAFVSLGKLAHRGQTIFPKTHRLAKQLLALTKPLLPLATDIGAVAQSFDNTGGIEDVMRFIYYYAGSVNGEDSLGHYIRTLVQLGQCTRVPSGP